VPLFAFPPAIRKRNAAERLNSGLRWIIKARGSFLK
jgi:transposase-like protein